VGFRKAKDCQKSEHVGAGQIELECFAACLSGVGADAASATLENAQRS